MKITFFLIFVLCISTLSFAQNKQLSDNERRVLLNDIKLYEKAIRKQPRSYQILNNWGGAYIQLHDYDNAIVIYKRMAQLFPADATAYYFWGVALSEQGKAQEAIEKLKITETLKPSDSLLVNSISTLYVKHGHYNEAIALYKKVLLKDSLNADAHLNWANALYAQHDYHNAIERYQKAIVINPANKQAPRYLANAYFRWANMLYEKGDMQKALAIYPKLAQLAPHSVAVYLNWADALLSLKREKESANIYQKALEIAPNNLTALYNLATMLYRQKKYKEATTLYRQVVFIQPTNTNAQNNLASALERQGKHDEALAIYGKMKDTERGANQIVAYFNKAIKMFDQQDYTQSLALYEQVIVLDGTNAEAYYGKASALFELDRMPEAIEYFKMAIQQKTNYASAYNNLAAAQLNCELYEEALANYFQTLEMDTKYVLAFYYCDQILDRLQRTHPAIYQENVGKLKNILKQNEGMQHKSYREMWSKYM